MKSRICIVYISLRLTIEAVQYDDTWRNWCAVPRFFDIASTWKWVVSFTPLWLYPRKQPLVPTGRRMAGPHNRYGKQSERKHFVSTGTRTTTPCHTVPSQSHYRHAIQAPSQRQMGTINTGMLISLDLAIPQKALVYTKLKLLASSWHNWRPCFVVRHSRSLLRLQEIG